MHIIFIANSGQEHLM